MPCYSWSVFPKRHVEVGTEFLGHFNLQDKTSRCCAGGVGAAAEEARVLLSQSNIPVSLLSTF